MQAGAYQPYIELNPAFFDYGVAGGCGVESLLAD
jgi:hypothetical protein